MKFFLTMTFLCMTSSSFAISTEKLNKACKEVGTQKILMEARGYGLEVDPATIKECGVDNRPFNIASYVWFCGTTSGGEKKIKVLTQKPVLRPCF